MSNIFLEGTILGDLLMKNIYEYFEGPKFFSVTNEVGSVFLIYWIGDEEIFDKWLIIPVSQERLEDLERKKIDINSVLSFQEQKKYYQVNIFYNEKLTPQFSVEDSLKIQEKIKLPKPSLFISSVTPVLNTGKLGRSIEFSTHEIHIEKSSKGSRPLVLSGVSRVFECFNELYNSILNYSNTSDLMTPVSGRPGSFALSFQAEKMEQFEPLFISLNEVINIKGDLVNFLSGKGIDIQVVNELFLSVVDTSTDFELKSKFDERLILKIRKSDADFYVSSLSRVATQLVSSIQVPQANIIEKVFEVVDLKWNNIIVCPETISLEERHVLYYIHAAKTLGFLSNSGAITALGQQIAMAKKDENKRLRIAARAFESSHCGWAWVMWNNVDNIKEIDPASAENFLMDKCHSLSKKTIKRRASTLRKWWEKLENYYSPI
ncbi:DUF6575 domain-containing protein [Pantoea agglomerans]|uniref:DUF6575 domain-containing protein n=1 Tax=Enterobacter agglomerans TaxID=549 RepID=UPI002D78A5EB|nr:DUF6575 domain-containing protein [Pantoea agglomerans]WRO91270.1 DUF6575 domain-containing protein [Pantoea agglomerans]